MMRSVTLLKSYCAEYRPEIQRAGGERLRGDHQELIVKTWENDDDDDDRYEGGSTRFTKQQ